MPFSTAGKETASMSLSIEELPWLALRLSESEIPWPDLDALAAAATESAEVRQRLMWEADRAIERRMTEAEAEAAVETVEDDLTDIAVPAVFALAADRLEDDARREVARFLIDLIVRTNDFADDYLPEALEKSAGRLGSAIVRPVLDVLEAQDHDLDAYYLLWSLLWLAKDADAVDREAAVNVCLRQFAEIQPGYDPEDVTIDAALALSAIDPARALEPIRALHDASRDSDLKELLDQLESGVLAAETPELPWNIPVEDWLSEIVREIRGGHPLTAEEGNPDGWDNEEDYWESDDPDRPLTTLGESYFDDLDDMDKPGDGPILRTAPKVGRNAPCPCGSGKKYKKCCGREK